MRALIVADGDVAPLEELVAGPVGRLAGDERLLVIAADGGLRKAQAVGLAVDMVVGDGDSLSPDAISELPRRGIDFQRHPVAKDASDTELALREAVRRGAAEVFVLGALGGLRVDHALANLLLLAASDLQVPVTLLDRATAVRIIGGPAGGRLVIDGAAGDVVSLLALSEEVRGVRLRGLEYPLDGGTLRRGSSLGLSNVLLGQRAEVSVDGGRLAVIHVRQGARA